MSVPPYAVLCVVGLVAFAGGMVMWSSYRRDWVDSVGVGLAAGGLVLLAAGLAMAPGWGS